MTAKIRAGIGISRTAKPPRIPGAVPLLVVARDHLSREAVHALERRDDALAEPRMLANLVQLVGREWALLREDVDRDPDHPDVVQPEPCGELGVGRELGRDRLGKPASEPRDALGVGRGLAEPTATVIVKLERASERLDDPGDRRRRGRAESGSVSVWFSSWNTAIS